ncbi:putative estradiol 17 beta-dehydrogenase [Jackrogersella minutella]|nr:putative estradiol 17 beta-dehydrogenase [Jackrogersella minutella]
MPSFASFWTHFFPPKPTFTEEEVPDLQGKVYIVTGANTGIGKEVARQLYKKNAKVYVAARSEAKAQHAIEDIKESVPSSTGSLVFLHLDLSDLPNVKAAAETFLAQEERLHSLFNNAGVMVSPVEPPLKTVQGYELSLGVNCVGTFLFTKLLTPILVTTAKASLPNTVRIIWPTSYALELRGHEGIGLSTDNLDYHIPIVSTERYGLSKAGVWALGVEYSRRYKTDGIISVPINPGNIASGLARDQAFKIRLIASLVCYPTIRGAITELYAAFSPEVTTADWSKTWVGPFGRILPLRPDLPRATLPEAEGGTGGTEKFWEWTEQQVKSYL